ncbi:MAG: hypothetical protein J6R18_08900 [Kiritimatiellae bacterium]|nr:hypothetical protein [Kiritimatiellia bacterium]
MSDSLCNYAIDAFHDIERKRKEKGRVPPLARLGVVVAFLFTLVSFGKYDLDSVASLAVYPMCLICFEGVRILGFLKRFWFLLIPVFSVGIINPFIDKEAIAHIGGIPLTGGVVSFAVLMLKGVLSMSVTWSLLRKAGAGGIADSMIALRFPPSFALAILLMHRYIVIMIKEYQRMRDAYCLRSAKGLKCIAPSAWGAFAGQLLIRSVDRAENVHAAIELRGGVPCVSRVKNLSPDEIFAGFSYFFGWTLFSVSVSFFEPMRLVGDAIRGLME